MLRSASCLKLLLFTVLLTANVSFADNLVFDRGLPTANLNNAAGASRSNVAWADWEETGTPTWAIGDNFKFGTSGQNYTISTLRVWLVEGNNGVPTLPDTTSLTLYGRQNGSAAVATSLAAGWTATPIQYAGGLDYQGSSGNMRQLWQIDFTNLNWSVAGDTLYDFYVGGTNRAYSEGGETGPFVSASNAALSVSTQQGADDHYYAYDQTANKLYTYNSNGNGWDKSSDVNVQVFTAPEPAAYVELAAGFIGACFFVVRRRRIGLR